MSERPEDVDAEFAAIVADLEREGLGSGVRADPERTEDLPRPGKPENRPDEPTSPPAAAQPGQSWRGHDAEWDWSWGSDDEHYVPPEPPPLPRLRPMTIVALVLVVAGVVLLIVPGLLGADQRITTPVALLSLVCGFVLLFLRIRRTSPDSDHDNGAQI